MLELSRAVSVENESDESCHPKSLVRASDNFKTAQTIPWRSLEVMVSSFAEVERWEPLLMMAQTPREPGTVVTGAGIDRSAY
jgi:hypothetical protein